MPRVRAEGPFLAACLFCATFLGGAARPASAQTPDDAGGPALWYRSAASNWTEALPIGNGRIGLMVWGQTHHETLSLDESTCWSGKASPDTDSPNGPEAVKKMRELIFAGKWTEARKLGPELYSKRGDYGTNLPFGHVQIDLQLPSKQSQNYRRELDLADGIAKVSYTNGDAVYASMNGDGQPDATAVRYRSAPGHYAREAFVSNPDQVVVVRLTCDKPGGFGFFVSLDGAENPCSIRTENGDTLVMDGRAVETMHSDGAAGVGLHARVRVVADGGTVTADGNLNRLQISGARSAVIYIALGTTFGGNDPVAACRRQIDHAVATGYDELRRRQVADFRRLFDRVSIDLGPAPNPKLPIDERLEQIRNGGSDPDMVAILFQYMRYILISASRENSPLPMHLLGVWNDDRAARMPWSEDHHLDINVSEQYWPAEVGNLPECDIPLMNWIADTLRPSGRVTARVQYGCGGWVAHASSNAWGYSGAGWAGWAPFVAGGAWIASHMWEHYRYTGDRRFLADRAYPVLKESAQFFLDYMVRDPKYGWLVTGPSVSPENSFIDPEGGRTSWSMGPTCDVAIVRQLFDSCMEAGSILGIDADFRRRLETVRENLPPFQIGKSGQLQEWLEDYKEALPGHRHMMHLLSVYPFDEITVEKTPALAKAALVSVTRRLSSPGDIKNLGWSRMLAAVELARLGATDAAYRQLYDVMRLYIANNLLDWGWGGNVGARFPIASLDGNGGFSTAVCQMLLQDYDGTIKLLPGMPEEWKNGHVTGLCARGGFVVDQTWQDHRLVHGAVHSRLGGRCRLQTAEALSITRGGQPLEGVEAEDGTFSFDTEAGETYEFTARDR